MSSVHRATLRLRKSVRRYIALPRLQQPFRLLYRVALAGMNYGGACSTSSSGDELPLERLVTMRARSTTPAVVLDVGANVGSYVSQVLRIVGDDTVVYAFEPSSTALTHLRRKFGTKSNVHLVAQGVGAASGAATLWADIPGSVLASTYVNPMSGDVPGEPIQLVTLDAFCEQRGIDRVDLLKLDLEGGELDALRGARRLLEVDAIAMIQFEFGQASLGARTFFSDLFGLLTRRFKIYRILPNGLEPIAAYHETLEVFMSTNYLAVSRALDL